jgi:hypothetical protein
MEQQSSLWIKHMKEYPDYPELRFKKLNSGFYGYPLFNFDKSILDNVDLETFLMVEKDRIPLFVGTQFGIYPGLTDLPDFYKEDRTIAILGKSILSGHVSGLGLYLLKADSGNWSDRKIEIAWFENGI